MTMNRTFTWVAGSVLVLAVVGGGTGVAIAGGTDSDQPLTGSALERAVDSALAETGGGEVIDSEVGDDEAAYSVEIRLTDGSQVEVNLDADFVVIGQEADSDSGAGDE
jgi:hypothetical protein